MITRRFCLQALTLLVGAQLILGANTRAVAVEVTEVDRAAFEQAVDKAINFLRTTGQNAEGAYSPQVGPGVTALATMALMRHGRSVDDPQVAKSLKYLETFVQPDGSITSPKPGTTTYDTSLCSACFSMANKDGRYREVVSNANNFLRGIQRDEGEGRNKDHADYGGAGYTAKTPGGDLSNTHMLLDALEDAGTSPDDEAVKRALIFVSRCQNLESEHNRLEFAAKVNDGGFYYSPVGPGYSAAGKAEQGALRSYGSMTYAGLKSMIYAGLTADDPRVKAATKWLETNYTVEENPGLGTSGLYYYYQLMGKALDAVGSPTFKDASGKEHNWRAELSNALIKRQLPDGSWINADRRWYESDPNLATSFALLSLSYCRPSK